MLLAGFNSGCAPSGQIQEMHQISVWWESIQYTLIGVGEILTSISSYELFLFPGARVDEERLPGSKSFDNVDWIHDYRWYQFSFLVLDS